MTMEAGSQDPVAGTGDWIFEHDGYKSWLEQGGILYVHGRTGVGKSTLMRILANNAMSEITSSSGIVLRFFFSRASELQRSPVGFFRSLLHQILCSNEEMLNQFLEDTEYVKKCKKSGKPGRGWDWQSTTLRPLLDRYLHDLASCQQVKLFVDALDQCEEKGVKAIVEMFVNLSKICRANVRICMSSAPFRDGGNRVLQPGKHSWAIDLQRSNHPDIRKYLECVFSDLEGSYNNSDLMNVKNRLVERTSGVFRWASSVAEHATSAFERGDTQYVLSAVNSLPSELDEVYAATFNAYHSPKEAEIAFRLFKWLTFAVRPMSLKEIQHAVCVPRDEISGSSRDLMNSDHWIEDDDKLINRISSLSHGMVRRSTKFAVLDPSTTSLERATASGLGNSAGLSLPFQDFHIGLMEHAVANGVETTVMEFDHESVYSFMKAKGLQLLANQASGSSNLTTRPYSSVAIVRDCFQYLRTKEVTDFVLGRKGVVKNGQIHLSSERQSVPPLMISSYKTLLSRMKVINDKNMITEIDELLHYLARLPSTTWSFLWNVHELNYALFWEDTSSGRNILHHLAYHGLKNVLSRLFDIQLAVDPNSLVNARDASGGSPRFFAAGGGHDDLVSLLLENGADAAMVDVKNRSPLWIAAGCGRYETVETLLQAPGAEVDLRDSENTTLIFNATFHNHIKIVELLLACSKFGAHSESSYSTEPRTNHNVGGFQHPWVGRDRIRFTPLESTWMRGNREMMEVLLNCPNIDPYLATSETEGKILLHLYAVGNLEVDAEYRAALQYYPDRVDRIIQRRRDARDRMAKLIAQSGRFDPEVKESRGHTPLAFAAAAGRADAIKQLLYFANIDVNVQDGDGHTPLILAIRRGSPSCVELLLGTERVDAEIQTALKHTAVQVAVALGRIKTLRMLCRGRGVDLKILDTSQRSLLCIAVMRGHPKSARLLIDKGCWNQEREAETTLKVLQIARDLTLMGRKVWSEKELARRQKLYTMLRSLEQPSNKEIA